MTESLLPSPYLPDREITITDYTKAEVFRIDWVHMPLDLKSSALNRREQRIIRRILDIKDDLLEAGIKIKKISGPNLEQSLEAVNGKIIVVGGGIEDECCKIRARLIREANGIAIIDLALTTKY